MNKAGAMLFSLALFAGCGAGSSPGGGPGPTGTGDMGSSPQMGDMGMTGTGGDNTLSGTVSKDQTLSGKVVLSDNVTIDPGVTLTLSPGTIVAAAPGKYVLVKGTLAVQGTEAAPVRFQSQANSGPGEWSGIDIAKGGTVMLTHGEIHNADKAIQTAGGAHYSLDYLTVDTSTAMLWLLADGTISHSKFHGLGDSQSEDPVQVQDASPHISDSLFDRARPFVDFITVGGSSSAVFDHLEVTQCHCAFHFNQGTNVTISNSDVHGNAYGLMVERSSQTQVLTSNFVDNDTNIGICVNNGSVRAAGVYFKTAAFDDTCATQKNESPAPNTVPNTGPHF